MRAACTRCALQAQGAAAVGTQLQVDELPHICTMKRSLHVICTQSCALCTGSVHYFVFTCRESTVFCAQPKSRVEEAPRSLYMAYIVFEDTPSRTLNLY